MLLLGSFSFLFLSKKSFKGNCKQVPILKLNFLAACLCMPITLLLDKFNIGEPEEPCSVLHVWLIS